MAMEERDIVALLGHISGGTAAGLGGAVVAPDKRIRTGLSAGAGGFGGAMLGGAGGAAAGGLGGAALGGLGNAGYTALMNALSGKDTMRGVRDAGIEGAGTGAELGVLLGALGGGMYGAGRGAREGYDFIHPQEKQGSHMQQNNIKLAFNLGAFQAIKEAEIDPLAIIQLAEETQDPELLAVAEALLELADAMGDDGMGLEGGDPGMDPGMGEMGMDPGMQGMGGEEDIDPAVLEQLMALTQGA